MKKLFFICCLVHVSLICYGQRPVVQAGVYTSFWGFKNNKPLPDVKVFIVSTIKEDSLPYIPYTALKLKAPYKLKKRWFVKSMLWGFHDGEDLYVSSNNYNSSLIVRFSKILHYGRYAYFCGVQEVRERTGGIVGPEMGGLVGGVFGTIPLDYYYTLDMEQGHIFPVSNTTVEGIVRQDPELHQLFQEDQHHDKRLFWYIEEFNRRNPLY